MPTLSRLYSRMASSLAAFNLKLPFLNKLCEMHSLLSLAPSILQSMKMTGYSRHASQPGPNMAVENNFKQSSARKTSFKVPALSLSASGPGDDGRG
mmetsp:Transcript_10927/g.19489  ORF Transcript_10927/g.19489 Transcript_10927/m.19489 type:complete len:96 (+) Transcript_10927:732-1019(+)